MKRRAAWRRALLLAATVCTVACGSTENSEAPPAPRPSATATTGETAGTTGATASTVLTTTSAAAAGTPTSTAASAASSDAGEVVHNGDSNNDRNGDIQIDQDGRAVSLAGTDAPESETDDPKDDQDEPLWDFGDGESARGHRVEHRYRTPGHFTILRTTDANVSRRTITIGEPRDAPDGIDGVAITFATRGRVVDFQAISASGSFAEPRWDFGDGSTAAVSAPVHRFEVAGVHTVRFSAGPAGPTAEVRVPVDESTRHRTVLGTDLAGPAEFLDDSSEEDSDRPPPARDASVVPSFSAEIVGDFVAVTSTSTGGPFASIEWDFGDGSTATGRTASHRYEEVGRATIVLRVATQRSAASTSMTVELPFDPPIETRQREFTVDFDFADSAPVARASWSFGDGAEAEGRQVSHDYGSPGTRTATVIVTADDGRVIERRFPVEVLAPIEAAFDVVRVDCATVRLVDRSAAGVTSRIWLFGDGETSTVRSPTHRFGEAGTYEITLQASNRAFRSDAVATFTSSCDSG